MRFAILVTGLIWASSASATDLSGTAGFVSDYRYRGLSLSAGRPAIQASLAIEDGSGLYAEIWGSTLGAGEVTESEVDFTAGLERELGPSISVDVSGSYFSYPSAGADNYFEATAAATLTRGAPRQR